MTDLSKELHRQVDENPAGPQVNAASGDIKAENLHRRRLLLLLVSPATTVPRQLRVLDPLR